MLKKSLAYGSLFEGFQLFGIFARLDMRLILRSSMWGGIIEMVVSIRSR